MIIYLKPLAKENQKGGRGGKLLLSMLSKANQGQRTDLDSTLNRSSKRVNTLIAKTAKSSVGTIHKVKFIEQLRKESILKPLAKANQGQRTDLVPTLAQSNIGKVRDIIAKSAKVSHGTIDKVKFIEQKADEETKKNLSLLGMAKGWIRENNNQI